jgi:hypothetical protein
MPTLLRMRILKGKIMLITKTLSVFIFAGIMLMQNSYGEDIFSDNLSRDYKPKKTISIEDTIGGYPIFQGGRIWQVIEGNSTENNVQVKLGYIHLISSIGNQYFSEMTLMVNLSQGNSYFVTEPCKGTHLVKNDLGGGQFDNCMTIDPFTVNIKGKNITALLIGVKNSKAGARLYDLRLLLNLTNLGFPDSSIYDWSIESVKQDQTKVDFVKKITDWAKLLQSGVDKAIGYDKPKDAFSLVPSISFLLKENDRFGGGEYNPFGTGSRFINGNTDEKYKPFGKETEPYVSRPIVAPTVPNRITLEQRLTELKTLLDRGVITMDEYVQKRALVINQF